MNVILSLIILGSTSLSWYFVSQKFMLSQTIIPIDKAANATTTSISPVKKSTGIETYSAAEMCEKYSELIYITIKNPILLADENTYIKFKDCHDVLPLIVNRTLANPNEFPHMALLGYYQNSKSNAWFCGGSLISNRWILSAAHCEKSPDSENVKWARLGELNYLADTDGARPKDYKIVQRVIHPNYKPPILYNDTASFRFEEDVTFSPYVHMSQYGSLHAIYSSAEGDSSNWSGTDLPRLVCVGLGFKSHLPVTVFNNKPCSRGVNKGVRNRYIDKHNTLYL